PPQPRFDRPAQRLQMRLRRYSRKVRGRRECEENPWRTVPLHRKRAAAPDLARQSYGRNGLQEQWRTGSRKSVGSNGELEWNQCQFVCGNREAQMDQFALFAAGAAEFGQERRHLAKYASERFADLADLSFALRPTSLAFERVAQPLEPSQKLLVLERHVYGDGS